MSILTKAGSALLLFWICFFLMIGVPLGDAVAGPSSETTERSWVEAYIVPGGAFDWIALFLGLLVVVFTLKGLSAVRAPDAWPHWRRLVRGLGEAGFLLGILGSFTGIAAAMSVIARMGAAVTPSHLAGGIAASISSIVIGGWVCLLGLIGGGLLRMRMPARDAAAEPSA